MHRFLCAYDVLGKAPNKQVYAHSIHVYIYIKFIQNIHACKVTNIAYVHILNQRISESVSELVSRSVSHAVNQ